uniref:Uncharacterized protein n=1 Tax=Magnetococcus massalia (strain MO-1) TaxID=451514 RepID=A0A1S7LHC8_MAGMO|nr:protein of unknown function [Candidatus Magnetococcus massalia]
MQYGVTNDGWQAAKQPKKPTLEPFSHPTPHSLALPPPPLSPHNTPDTLKKHHANKQLPKSNPCERLTSLSWRINISIAGWQTVERPPRELQFDKQGM